MNEVLMRRFRFNKECERIKAGCCGLCGNLVSKDEFRDEVSRREYGISGSCQKCQDKVFVEEEDNG